MIPSRCRSRRASARSARAGATGCGSELERPAHDLAPVRALQPDPPAEAGHRVDDQPEPSAHKLRRDVVDRAARDRDHLVELRLRHDERRREGDRVRHRQRAGDQPELERAAVDARRRPAAPGRSASADPVDATNSTAAMRPRAAHLADERVVVEGLVQPAVQVGAAGGGLLDQPRRSRSRRGSRAPPRRRAGARCRCSRGRRGRAARCRRRARSRPSPRRGSRRAGRRRR